MAQSNREEPQQTSDLTTIDTGASRPETLVASDVAVVPGFDVVQVLGHGGMGVVLQAYDRKHRRMVAIKTLRRLDPTALYALKQEFRSLAGASHRNLVNYYELISADPQWFLSMELIAGRQFLAHVRGDDAAAGENIDRLRTAFGQLAQGVEAIHQMGKLHRDLKPSNVLVENDGRVVILDFGLAAELDHGGRHQGEGTHIVGTVAYMAPEQAAAEAVSPASDWYSVGCMLYEALTGRLPFEGDRVQVLLDKQRCDAQPPRLLAPGIPDDLDALCVALLQRSPAARPTGGEVLSRLGAVPEAREFSSSPAMQQILVGREHHLEELREAFAASRAGSPTKVLIHGRSGAGKSVLVKSFLNGLLESEEAVVLAGKCYERESVPYKALDSLVDALSGYLEKLSRLEAEAILPREVHSLTQVFPVLGRVETVASAPGSSVAIVDANESRRRAFAALRQLLARLADRRPLVLFVDDLQWGDAESAAALAELLRPPDAPPLLMVGSYRSEERESSECLRMLLNTWEHDVRDISVDPLSEQEARRLAMTLLEGNESQREAIADRIARESGGNPFFVQVLAQGLVGQANPTSAWESSEPLALDDLLWRRVQELPDEARRLLELVAVSGQPLDQAEAFQAADMSSDRPATLARLRFDRLVRSAGAMEREAVETYHDRVRETILARLPPTDLQNRHRRLALAAEVGSPGTELEFAL